MQETSAPNWPQAGANMNLARDAQMAQMRKRIFHYGLDLPFLNFYGAPQHSFLGAVASARNDGWQILPKTMHARCT